MVWWGWSFLEIHGCWFLGQIWISISLLLGHLQIVSGWLKSQLVRDFQYLWNILFFLLHLLLCPLSLNHFPCMWSACDLHVSAFVSFFCLPFSVSASQQYGWVFLILHIHVILTTSCLSPGADAKWGCYGSSWIPYTILLMVSRQVRELMFLVLLFVSLRSSSIILLSSSSSSSSLSLYLSQQVFQCFVLRCNWWRVRLWHNTMLGCIKMYVFRVFITCWICWSSCPSVAFLVSIEW